MRDLEKELACRFAFSSEGWGEMLRVLGINAIKRPGSFLVICVFHYEKTPSLRFWPSGNYHCFGCGNDGNRLDFLVRYFNLHLGYKYDPRQGLFQFIKVEE